MSPWSPPPTSDPFPSPHHSSASKPDDPDTLIDYFCVIGGDQTKTVQIAALTEGRELVRAELAKVQPQLICKFPLKNRLKMDAQTEQELVNVIL